MGYNIIDKNLELKKVVFCYKWKRDFLIYDKTTVSYEILKFLSVDRLRHVSWIYWYYYSNNKTNAKVLIKHQT